MTYRIPPALRDAHPHLSELREAGVALHAAWNQAQRALTRMNSGLSAELSAVAAPLSLSRWVAVADALDCGEHHSWRGWIADSAHVAATRAGMDALTAREKTHHDTQWAAYVAACRDCDVAKTNLLRVEESARQAGVPHPEVLRPHRDAELLAYIEESAA